MDEALTSLLSLWGKIKALWELPFSLSGPWGARRAPVLLDSQVQVQAVSSVPLPADAARPLLLLGQVSESHGSRSSVIAMQGGRIQPGLEMLLPARSLDCPSDLQMLGPGPVVPSGSVNTWPKWLPTWVMTWVSADCRGLKESMSQPCRP